MANTPTLINSVTADYSSPASILKALVAAVNTLDQRTAGLDTSGVASTPATLPIPVYTLLTLPSAETYKGRLIIVSDATPTNSLCVSDGTNWKFVTFGATVS